MKKIPAIVTQWGQNKLKTNDVNKNKCFCIKNKLYDHLLMPKEQHTKRGKKKDTAISEKRS